jgi:peptidoglycan/LPS O-acetylase OafA/YrhL
MLDSTKVYFPNLNGLRFIAAFMVIIHHLEQMLSIFGYDNYWDNKIIKSIGGLGVELFFVLSGFLITYLLLTEEARTKKISIRSFYIRRILRIWPLYYFIVILAFFILPNMPLWNIPKYSVSFKLNFFFLYILFLPNIIYNSYGIIIPYVSQAWSVGVEEQFYLIWPLLMKFFKNKFMIFMSVIVIYILIKFIGFRFVKHFVFWNTYLQSFRLFWSSFQIDCMAIGGLFSYLLFKNHKLLSFVFNKFVFGITLLLTFMLIYFSVNLSFFSQEIFSILFGIIIINLSANKNGLLLFENRLFNFLGKISYGLYMYHVIVIVSCIQLFRYLDLLKYHMMLLCVCLLLTIILASLSYLIFEKQFLELKRRYSIVISGDN